MRNDAERVISEADMRRRLGREQGEGEETGETLSSPATTRARAFLRHCTFLLSSLQWAEELRGRNRRQTVYRHALASLS